MSKLRRPSLTLLHLLIPETFSLSPALAQKYGYSSVDDFVNNSQKDFSLLESGIVEQPSSRLLLVNVSSLEISTLKRCC